MKKVKRIIVLALTVIKRVIAVLDFPKDIDDFITYAKTIHNAMLPNALFAALLAKINTLADCKHSTTSVILLQKK